MNFDGCCHCWSDLHKYGVANINNDNTCNNNGCSGKNIILCWTNIRRWFHSLCYWNVWVSSFLFWFIFYHLCIKHYRASLVIFFSHVNAYFSLLIMCIHSLGVWISHSNSSVGHYTWSRFLISSTHYNYYTFVISWFVANDNFLVLGFHCYCWSSFHSHGSYLHRVFSLYFVHFLLSFFLWVVFICALICLILLMDGFSSLIFYTMFSF